MHATSKILLACGLVAYLSFFTVGCVTTTIKSNGSAFVYIAENGTITYRGNLYSSPDQVAKKLLIDGATPSTLVTLIPQGTIPAMHLKGISNDFGKRGLSHVVIREQKKISASIQKRGDGIKPQPPPSTPKIRRQPQSTPKFRHHWR